MPRLDTVKQAIAATKAARKRIRWSYRDGVSLVVTPTGGARWYFQGRGPGGKTNTVPIGPGTLTMRQALDARPDAKAKLKSTPRNQAGSTTEATAERTFGEVVEEFIKYKCSLPNGDGWRGGHKGDEASAYRRTLKGLWSAPIATLDTPAIGDVIEKMPARTAIKTQVRVKAVCDWARAKGYRAGENPAAKALLTPRMAPAPPVKHHRALSAADIPRLMQDLEAIDTVASRALRFTILTAARTDETLSATWAEILLKGTIVPTADGSRDEALAGDEWIIGRRMKERRQHRVPLTRAMWKLLGDRGDGLIFTTGERSMLHLLRRFWPGFDVHGLRSTLTDWAAKRGYDADLHRTALAHPPLSSEGAHGAYQRDELCEERRPMMEAWSDYVAPQGPQAAAVAA